MIHGFDSEQYLEDKLKEFESKKWYKVEDGMEIDGFMLFDDCKRCFKECDKQKNTTKNIKGGRKRPALNVTINSKRSFKGTFDFRVAKIIDKGINI